MLINRDFAIGIPTINRWDLLKETQELYAKTTFPSTAVFIIDNGCQGIPPYSYCIKDEEDFRLRPLEPLHQFAGYSPVMQFMPKNIGVAASWNRLLQSIFRYWKWALIVNDDICLAHVQSTLQAFLQTEADDSVLYECPIEPFAAFLISKPMYETVGPFDEGFFPAYYEDTDYKRRIELAGLHRRTLDLLQPSRFISSGSIQRDPSLNKDFQRNVEYYKEKWGGIAGLETFTTPFNK